MYVPTEAGRVTRATVGCDTNQSFRVCNVNLATLKVAINSEMIVVGERYPCFFFSHCVILESTSHCALDTAPAEPE